MISYLPTRAIRSQEYLSLMKRAGGAKSLSEAMDQLYLMVTVWTGDRPRETMSLKQHPLMADPREVGLALFVGEAPTGWLGWENTVSPLSWVRGR